MSIKAIDLRRGMGVMWDGQVTVVHSIEHVTKGKGRAYMHVQFKNVQTGQIIANRFRVDHQLEEVFFERKSMEYLYSDGGRHIVMDGDSYEQVELPAELISEKSIYLTPNIPLQVAFVNGTAVSVELPNTVELKVIDVPPEVKGATATSQLKDALCEGGARVKVPAFVRNGQIIKVDTRCGEYLGRA